MDEERPITLLLQDVSAGQPQALDRLVDMVYGEMRRLARKQLSRERSGHTLDSSALVHQVYENLRQGENLALENRRHLFGVLANSMRRLLVDHARARNADKRGGGAAAQPYEDLDLAVPSSQDDRTLAVDEALKRLAEVDPEAAEIVHLRYFTGLNEEEAAAMMGLSRATAGRRWAFAKAWLQRELAEGIDL